MNISNQMSDNIGLVVVVCLFVGAVIYLSKKEAKAVSFDVADTDILKDGMEITGSWKHGAQGYASVSSATVGSIGETVLETGLHLLILDSKKNHLKKIPVVITSEDHITKGWSTETHFKAVLDLKDVPSGSGYLLLNSRGIDLGAKRAVNFG